MVYQKVSGSDKQNFFKNKVIVLIQCRMHIALFVLSILEFGYMYVYCFIDLVCFLGGGRENYTPKCKIFV